MLTGFMGTGKSAVGRALADRLDRPWVDTDDLIERRHGPIPEIFQRSGEEGFRAAEREVAEELADRPGLVISTGGRFLLDPVNARLLGRRGIGICLTARVETLLERLLGEGVAGRPLLAGPDPAATIAGLLDERAEGYGAFPSVTTDDRTVDEVVEAVLRLVEAD